MAISAEFADFLLELFEPLEDVTLRRMFGGAGIFCHGVMFALIVREQLYFKVDDENRPMFEDEGCEPFTYETSKGARGVMSYYEAPDFLYDEEDEMLVWARGALDAALRSANSKKSKGRKRA